MKIAYCGYDFFCACLQALIDSKQNKSYEVYRIFTVPSRGQHSFNQYIYEIASGFDIPISEERIDENTVKQLREEGCELLITAAYNYKIPPLEAYNIKAINIHPTLLPVGRGEWPLPWTILTKQTKSGVSIHKHTQDYDAGDILLQQSFDLLNNECLETLSAKTQLLAKDLLSEVLSDFQNYWDSANAQIVATHDVSLWNIPAKQDRTLDWSFSIEILDRICRAFGKFGCHAQFNNQHWLVYQLKAWPQQHDFQPGIVVHKTNTEMIIAASDGLVSLMYFEKIE